MPSRRAAALLTILALTLSLPLHAQRHESALSEGEVEKLRDAAYVPADRVMVFITLIDSRTKRLTDLYAHPRRPGREEDTHDLIEQVTSVADELDDNLDDYDHRHQDIRKSLPKLILATDRWATELKTPPDNEAYSVSRKLALEAIQDIRDTATKLMDDQKAWFLAHPPPKDGGNNRPPPQ
jgi:hypothetical protein